METAAYSEEWEADNTVDIDRLKACVSVSAI